MTKDDQPSSEQDSNETREEMLTPWQRENIRYLEQHGDRPQWQEVEEELEADQELEEELLEEEERPEIVEEIETDESRVEQDKKVLKDLPKSRSFADKLPKMKVQRQQRLKKRLTLLVSLFGIAALGMIYYVSPLSKVNRLEIVGNQKVEASLIAKATKISDKDGIWSAYFDKSVLAKVKASHPRIKDVEVHLSKINNLKIVVTEFSEIAYAKEGKAFHPVLENGVILTNETVEQADDQFLVLINFTPGVSLENLMANINKVDEVVKNNIKEISSTPSKNNEYLVTMTMKDGNQIIASTKDYQDKINYYPQVASEMSEKGVVDMEAGIFSTSFDEIKKQKAEEKAKNDYEAWLKQLEDENKEKNNE